VSRPRLRLAALLAIVVSCSSVGGPAPLAGAQEKVRLLVTFRPGTASEHAARTIESRGGRVVATIPQLGVRVVELPAVAASRARATWAADPLVAGIEEDGLVQVDWTPTDPLWAGYQWEQRQVRMPRSWNTTRGARTTIIAVVDTGVQPDHPDLAGRLVQGRDVLNRDGRPADDNGHGTAVAGVVVASASNGIGVSGGCPRCRVMPIKALDANGSGYWSVAARGIIWAANHGADVINLSFGGPTGGSTLYNAIAYAKSKGAIVIASAGNNNSSSLFYPAAFDNVMSVAASTSLDLRYSWSNHSTSWVTLAAPGCTYSTALWSAYHSFCGTSAAAPVVSSVAALVRSRRPAWTNNRVEKVLIRSTVPTPYPFTRHGRIDAFAAVHRADRGSAPPDGVMQPAAPLLAPGTRLFLARGDHVGYRFDAFGGVVGSRRISLATASGADAAKRQTIPYRSGAWFHVATGDLAGYWVAESSRAYLDPQVRPTWPALDPTLEVSFAAGTHTGYRFDLAGSVLGSKELALGEVGVARTSKVARLPGQDGTWAYIVDGDLAGYWVRTGSEIVLQTDPLPAPSSSVVLRPTDPQLAPAQPVRLLPGRHIGYRLTTNGRVLRRRVLDLATTAETRSAKLMQLPGRGGWWLYIVEGKLSGFWVRATEQRHLRP
jgi:subtilisin family serine protease